MSPKRSSHKSDSETRWEAFKQRHRRRRSRSFSTDSLDFSDLDSTASSSLFSRFRPACNDVIFSPSKVYSNAPISVSSSPKPSRSRINLSFQKRNRATRKQLVTTRAVFNAPNEKIGPIVEAQVTRFQRRYSNIWTHPPTSFYKLTRALLRFQTAFLNELSPIQRDEFHSYYFKLVGLSARKPQTIQRSKFVNVDSNRSVYLFQRTLRAPNFKYFEGFRNSQLLDFFTLSSAKSLQLWQTLEQLAAPLSEHFWLFIDKFAPARFFLQPTLQDAFVDVFSLAPNSSPQYAATLARFANFINDARVHPTSNSDHQIAFALTALKRCDSASYYFIQGWLLKQLSRGLAFTTLRTYCLHLSWFQQPSPKRYAKTQQFKRFLIIAVARFFTDDSHHGSDAMDQETLNEFWKVFDNSSFAEAEYDKFGFIWMLQLALRVTESINNQWVNVDFNENNVGVVQKIRQAKNQHLYGKTYILALKATNDKFCPVRCLRYLAKHGTSAFVFYNRRKNRAWSTRSLNKRFQLYVQQLPSHLRKNKKFTVYSLRSTFACSMAQANVDVSLIQQFMRQKSITSTQTYIQKAFPHINFANLLAHTAKTSSTESFESTFLSNLTSVKHL